MSANIQAQNVCLHMNLKNKTHSLSLIYVKVLLQQIQTPACVQVFEPFRHNQACMAHLRTVIPRALFAWIYVTENFLHVSLPGSTLAALLESHR